MFKPSALTLLFAALGLSAGCIITTNDDGTTSATTHGDTGTHTSDPSTSGDGETSQGETSDGETSDAAETSADETGGTAACGWGATQDPEVPEGYVCGGDGEDPEEMFPIACPEGLEEGMRCEGLTGVGCCDEEGNVWFCWEEGGNQTVVKEAC